MQNNVIKKGPRQKQIQTYLLNRPERSLCLLIHLPNVRILDWEDYESSWVVSEQGFIFFVFILEVV